VNLGNEQGSPIEPLTAWESKLFFSPHQIWVEIIYFPFHSKGARISHLPKRYLPNLLDLPPLNHDHLTIFFLDFFFEKVKFWTRCI